MTDDTDKDDKLIEGFKRDRFNTAMTSELQRNGVKPEAMQTALDHLKNHYQVDDTGNIRSTEMFGDSHQSYIRNMTSSHSYLFGKKGETTRTHTAPVRNDYRPPKTNDFGIGIKSRSSASTEQRREFLRTARSKGLDARALWAALPLR